MKEKFNRYIDNLEPDFWRELCLGEGELRTYIKGEEFVSVGKEARYVGYIKSGTMKYIAYSVDNTAHVVGLEFAGEFVADFPFSLYGRKSRVTIVAETDCEIYCLPVGRLHERMETEPAFRDKVMCVTEALFDTVYDRYLALYTMTPQERYNDLFNHHPDLFALFSLKDIASFLNVTPTHLSRLRKNI